MTKIDCLPSLGWVSLLALLTACGGKFEPPASGGAGGTSNTGGEDAGVSGQGGASGSGGASCNGTVDPDKQYISRDPKRCQVIDFACPPDRVNFTDECGCGCRKLPTCENIQCIRAVNCVKTCGGPVVQSGCCPCPPPSFDDIVCRTDAGTCGCTSSALSWGQNGGLVASQTIASLSPCRTYKVVRSFFRTEQPDLTCSVELPCETKFTGPEDIASLLAHPDVQAALKVAPVVYGFDPRPMDGTILRIDIAGKTIDVGRPCDPRELNCRAVPAGIEALKYALWEIDGFGVRQPACREVFGDR